jgi:6-phosphogluconolactonase
MSLTSPDGIATVYVSNADSREISVLELDKRAGTLRSLQTVAVGGMAMPMALSPDRKVLYVALRSEPFAVAALRIDGSTGQLSPLGQAPLPDSMAYIATDCSGRWLLAASYGGHCASVSPIGDDGTPADAVQIVPNGRNAHAAVVALDNRHVYITSLGTDQVLQWRFDAVTGQLAPNVLPAMAARPGSGPRHLVFHPDGRHAYLLGELDATVELLAVDAANGQLSRRQHWFTLPTAFSGQPWGADLHLTPDGRFLYTSERNSSTLAIWRVDARDGMLTLVDHQATEQQPRGFQIDASGQWLLVAGQRSHSVTLYRIDGNSGRLTPAQRIAVGQGPNWIEIVDRS